MLQNVLSYDPDPRDGPDANDSHDDEKPYARRHGPPGEEAEDLRLGSEEPLGVGQIVRGDLKQRNSCDKYDSKQKYVI